MREFLADATKDELIDLVESFAKDIVAMDGVWFQAAEQSFGMDQAMKQDELAWERFAQSEARRMKKLLGLGQNAGLEGLAKVLRMRYSSHANTNISLNWEDEENALVYRIGDCRVQRARERKGMPLHPCKSVGIIEYRGLAKEIDPRIQCECISCYPDVTDASCSCAWRFTLK